MLGLLLAWSLTSTAIEFEVVTLDGREFAGVVTAVDRGDLTLRTANGLETLPLGDLLRVDGPPVARSRATTAQHTVSIALIDGSLLSAVRYSVVDGRCELEFATGDPLRISTRSVQTVRLKSPEAALDDQWQAILNSQVAGDLIAVRKTSASAAGNERQPGQAVLDQVEGILGNISEEQIEFAYDGAELTLSRAKVEGLIYHHSQPRRLPEPVCQLVDHTGSRWMARSMRLEGEVLAIITPAGVRKNIPLQQITRIDYSVGNLDYLDELPIESSEYQPHIVSSLTPSTVTSWFRPRSFNESHDQFSRDCKRGLALHSRSRLTYRLERDYERFKATVEIDDRFREQGQVLLVIEGNHRVLFEQEIRGSDDPLDLDIDLRGVQRLSILVDFGPDQSDHGDHLNICNARLTK